MTIRKRFDEAQDLIERGLYEPALVLLLVANAAAAEQLRKHKTKNRRKQSGDDRKWFEKYVNAELPHLIFQNENGNTITSASALYKDLRCELIHEAAAKEGAFSDDNVLMSVRGGRITFGIELLTLLGKTLLNDHLPRDQFRDILHPFQNIVEFYSLGTQDELIAKLVEDYGLSLGRYEILLRIVVALTPERIHSMQYEEMVSVFSSELLPDMKHAKLNMGALVALRMTQGDPVLDDSDKLTEAGADILKEISANYRTTDFANPVNALTIPRSPLDETIKSPK